MKVNLYAGVGREERKEIDRDLRERMKPKMFYETSYIKQFKDPMGIVRSIPLPANLDPKTGKTAPFAMGR